MPTRANNTKQDKVRELQVKLYLAAKRSPERRFHALWDRIHRRDVLQRAWQQVRENRGSAGVDRITIAQIEEERGGGVPRRAPSWSFASSAIVPGRRGGCLSRSPVAPSRGRWASRRIKDRVAQTAAKLVLEPIFEADFRDCSFGFRPKRSAHDALDAIKREVMRGRRWVIDADIRGFFDALDPEILEQLVCERISDRRVLKLLRSWMRAGVLEGGTLLRPEVGSPQGSPISPLLANVYLNALDRAWEDRHGGLGVLVRYCDDLVIVCRTRAQAEAALRELRALLAELRLELAEAKTRLVCLDNDGEGFDFLGFHHRMVESFSKPGFRVPGALAVGGRHASGEAEDSRADRPAAVAVAGRRSRGQPQPVSDRLGRLFPPGQLHDPVPQARPLHGRATGTLDREAPPGQRPLAYGYWRLRQERFFGLRPLVGRVHTAPRKRPGEGCR